MTRFPSTLWSQVTAAGDGARDALEALARGGHPRLDLRFHATGRVRRRLLEITIGDGLVALLNLAFALGLRL